MRLVMLLMVSFCLFNANLNAQENTEPEDMTGPKLESLIRTVGDSLAGSPGQWHFKVGEMWMMCLMDESHNRMRIMTPVIAVERMNDGEMEKCMAANFHTALDVKYCISEGILWSAFIHPLKELTPSQVMDAINQVHTAASTFGTIYTSTDLVFPGKKGTPKKGDSKS